MNNIIYLWNRIVRIDPLMTSGIQNSASDSLSSGLFNKLVMKEIWKDIKGYEGLYLISNYGNVKSLHFNNTNQSRKLKLKVRNAGYFYVNLSKNGLAKKHNVHRLVASAFIPNIENKPKVNHKNGIKTINVVSNLEWVTIRENEDHAKMNNLKANGERHGMAKLNKLQVRDIRVINWVGLFTRKQIAEEYSVTPETIGNIVNYKSWKNEK